MLYIIGYALETIFTLQAYGGWSDQEEDQPLRYRFGYKNSKDEDCFLGGSSLDSEVRVLLPTGFLSDSILPIFVDVSDNKGAISRAFFNVKVSPMSNFSEAAISNLARAATAAFQTMDISTIFGHLSSSVKFFNDASQTGKRLYAIISQ